MTKPIPTKHIVYIVARFLPYYGGAEQNCYQLAKLATDSGHRVTVLTTDLHPQDEHLPAFESVENINIVRIHAWNKHLNLGFYPAMLTKLFALKPDLIHVCNGAGFIWRDLCLFLWKSRHPQTPIIITPHGPFLQTPATHGLLRRLVGLTGKLVLFPYFRFAWSKLFTKMIAVNPHQHRWMKSDYGFDPTNIVTIPNGIAQNYIEPSLPSKSKDKLVITYLGRLEKYKGVQRIILAVKKALSENINIKLIIMGSGIYEASLRALVTQHNLDQYVEFIINPPNQTRDELLCQSDVNILLSDWEATGIGLLEAMAKGNIIVTSKQNEAADIIIRANQNGIVIDKDDITALANFLIKLYLQTDLRQEMQNNALRLVTNFTWNKVYLKYDNLIQLLLN